MPVAAGLPLAIAIAGSFSLRLPLYSRFSPLALFYAFAAPERSLSFFFSFPAVAFSSQTLPLSVFSREVINAADSALE